MKVLFFTMKFVTASHQYQLSLPTAAYYSSNFLTNGINWITVHAPCTVSLNQIAEGEGARVGIQLACSCLRRQTCQLSCLENCGSDKELRSWVIEASYQLSVFLVDVVERRF